MIRIIEQVLASQITGLNFIERYGGFVRPLTSTFGVGDNAVQKTFPVTDNLSEKQCFELGKWQMCVPNDQYKSVSYWEEVGGSTITMEGPKLNQAASQTTARFVCWMNMKKLGLDDVKGVTRFELATINAISGSHRFTDVDGIAGRVDVTRIVTVQNTPARVFGAYSYQDKQWAFFWPYAFFALDVTARVYVSMDCLTDVTLGTEISCLTNW